MIIMKMNKFIDHTILKANATREDIKKLCDEAKEYGFYSVCVNGCSGSWVSFGGYGDGCKGIRGEKGD